MERCIMEFILLYRTACHVSGEVFKKYIEEQRPFFIFFLYTLSYSRRGEPTGQVMQLCKDSIVHFLVFFKFRIAHPSEQAAP
jgi:hypothetical protein